jgi:SWI/SNF-related matrix-associated actin-dependent regulator of chromatin subfamily A member 5
LEAGADIEALDAANAAAGTDPAASAKLSFTELREIIMAGAGAVADAKTPGATDKKTRGGGGSSSDFKTPGSGKGGAQEEGVAALQRAAAGSGKKGHYNWEGHDYQKSKADADKRDIADVWVSSVGTKRRERISTVEYIDAGAGLGMQAVSRISIREAKEAEDRERRAAAAREEARAKSADRASRHETNCCECGGDEAGCLKPPPPFLAPEIAAERLRCRNCPRVMSLGCARLVTRPRMGWQCPQHHCKSCNRTASEAGGLMFRCVQCPTAFCAECNGETPFDAVEGNIPWEQLGFYLPKSFEYVMCGECCSTNEAKAKAAAIETPKEEKKEMPASAKKPRKR